MDASAFDESLGKALRLCRLAADLELPIAEMIAHVQDRLESILPAGPEMLGPDSDVPEACELEALREIIAAVGDVAAIGSKLAEGKGAVAPPDRPQTAPLSPPERTFPLPANLREA